MRCRLAALGAAMVLISCGGGTQPQPPDAAKTLSAGAAAMAQLKTLTATLKFTKGAISFQGFTLVSAKTSVKLPSDSDTTYTVKQQDISISLQVVISGGHVYLHAPFSNFQELAGANAKVVPDLARLFDTTTGLPAVIPAGTKPAYVSTDQIEGRTAYQISTSYTPAQVQGLLAQLDSSGPVNARIWVDASDHMIRKAVLDGPFGDGGKEASVEVDMAAFNSAVTIASPTP